jgi:hypothetical protein
LDGGAGQKVFEWDQTLEEVNMYIELPKNVPTKLIHCAIQAGHVEVGIRGNPPYLNVRGFLLTLSSNLTPLEFVLNIEFLLALPVCVSKRSDGSVFCSMTLCSP